MVDVSNDGEVADPVDRGLDHTVGSDARRLLRRGGLGCGLLAGRKDLKAPPGSAEGAAADPCIGTFAPCITCAQSSVNDWTNLAMLRRTAAEEAGTSVPEWKPLLAGTEQRPPALVAWREPLAKLFILGCKHVCSSPGSAHERL